MRRIALLVACAVINASAIPAAASECMSPSDLNASRARRATLLSQTANVEREKICRAYATSFYESVLLRQAAARCAGAERNLALLDAEIDAINELMSTKCSG